MLRWVGSQEFGVAEHSDTQWYTVVHSDTQWYSGVSEKQNKKQIGGILDLDGGIICWPRKYKSGGDHWKNISSFFLNENGENFIYEIRNYKLVLVLSSVFDTYFLNFCPMCVIPTMYNVTENMTYQRISRIIDHVCS